MKERRYIMDKYYIVLSNNTSNALYKRKLTGKERRYILVTEQLWKGDIFLAERDNLKDAEEYAESSLLIAY
jgi:hypothetical protein